jgi:Cof subfamily protein (haloacid dehalogenase superfamily)
MKPMSKAPSLSLMSERGYMHHFRLVATDLDGTLLHSDKSVSPRTRRVLAKVREAGTRILLVSGRPPRFLRIVAEDLDIRELAICGNGAIVYDPTLNAIIRHTPIPAAVARDIILDLRRMAPGICFAFEQELYPSCEPEYLTRFAYNTTEQAPLVDDALILCRKPVSKLIARHPTIPVAELLLMIESLSDERVLATFSGAPFVEISAREAQKSVALAWLCEEWGIQSSEVIAFGDMPNDLPMLRWAGHSVATANAHAELRSAVTEVTLSNDEDGVAAVLERLFCASVSPASCQPATH